MLKWPSESWNDVQVFIHLSDIWLKGVPKHHLNDVTVVVIRHPRIFFKLMAVIRNVSCICHQRSDDRWDCGSLSLRLAIWTQTRYLCLLLFNVFVCLCVCVCNQIKWNAQFFFLPCPVCMRHCSQNIWQSHWQRPIIPDPKKFLTLNRTNIFIH